MIVFVLRVRDRARVTSTITIQRLPLFGADPLRSATIHPVPREETWRPEAQGRGGWWQAQAVGELTRRGREGGRRGSDLLTQAGRISPEEPHILPESRGVPKVNVAWRRKLDAVPRCVL